MSQVKADKVFIVIQIDVDTRETKVFKQKKGTLGGLQAPGGELVSVEPVKKPEQMTLEGKELVLSVMPDQSIAFTHSSPGCVYYKFGNGGYWV